SSRTALPTSHGFGSKKHPSLCKDRNVARLAAKSLAIAHSSLNNSGRPHRSASASPQTAPLAFPRKTTSVQSRQKSTQSQTPPYPQHPNHESHSLQSTQRTSSESSPHRPSLDRSRPSESANQQSHSPSP